MLYIVLFKHEMFKFSLLIGFRLNLSGQHVGIRFERELLTVILKVHQLFTCLLGTSVQNNNLKPLMANILAVSTINLKYHKTTQTIKQVTLGGKSIEKLPSWNVSLLVLVHQCNSPDWLQQLCLRDQQWEWEKTWSNWCGD